MKKSLFLGALCGLVFLAGCDSMGVMPDDPNKELVDGTRVDNVTHHVHLSYALDFSTTGGDGELIAQAQVDGPALNFPGNQNNAGSCSSGQWHNKNGHPTSGSIDNPHPHCTVYVASDGEAVEIFVQLEPISVNYHVQNANNHQIRFTNQNGFNDAIKLLNNSGTLEGDGEIVAWAVLVEETDAGTFPTRVGTITIDLTQFAGDWDTVICTTDADPVADGCIKQVVDFSYEPLPANEGGIGEAGLYSNGFLWWKEADETYRAD